MAAPASPTGVTATTLLTDRITISWNASVGASGYNLYRSASGGGGTFNLVVANITTLSKSQFPPSITLGTGYYYKVTAYNSSGEESTRASAATVYGASVVPYPSVSVAPSVAAAGGTASVVVLRSSIVVAPSPASTRTLAKSPLQLSNSDVDGFFQFLGQVHAYTNYGYRKRDTYMAIDSINGIATWLYPTTSSDAFVDQLPRVLMSVDIASGRVGLGCPSPSVLTGTYVPLKTKNVFVILQVPPNHGKRKPRSIMCIAHKIGTADDTTSATEDDDKMFYLLDFQKFAGTSSLYSNAFIYTKFFRPPSSAPNMATRIVSVQPVFSHGNSSGLTMRAKLWTYNTYIVNDNEMPSTPSTESSLILDGGTILFDDSKYGLEHCVAIELDTNGGSSAWPPSDVYSGGAMLGLNIAYTEQEVAFR